MCNSSSSSIAEMLTASQPTSTHPLSDRRTDTEALPSLIRQLPSLRRPCPPAANPPPALSPPAPRRMPCESQEGDSASIGQGHRSSRHRIHSAGDDYLYLITFPASAI